MTKSTKYNNKEENQNNLLFPLTPNPIIKNQLFNSQGKFF